MKILIAGHPLAHPRQMLFCKELNKLCDVFCVAPTHWTIGLTQRPVQPIPDLPIKLLSTTIPGDWLHSQWIGLDQVIAEFKPDILYMTEEPWTIFALQGLNLAKKYGCKYAIFSYENLYKEWGEVFGKIENQVLKEADFIIAGCEEAKEVLIKKGANPEKISVLPLVGIDTNHFKSFNQEREFDCLYVGNHLPWKGCGIIDTVLKQLNVKFANAGEGPYKFMYSSKSFGYTSHLDLPKVYNAGKVLVHFSFPTTGWKEQDCFVGKEALACETLLVTENTRIMREIFDGCPGVFFAENDDPDSLKNAIKTALENFDSIDRTKCAKFIDENYSNKVIAKKLLEVFK